MTAASERPMRERPVSEDERALDRSILTAVAVFRWASLAWTVVVVVIDAANDSFAHFWLAVALVVAIGFYTVWATVLLSLRPAILLSPSAVLTELVLGGALVFFDNWAYSSVHSQSLGTAWPLAGIMMAGVLWAARGGFLAGLALGMLRLLGELRFVPGAWSGDQKLAAIGTIVLYSLAGGVAGFAATRLREAEHRISVARAREELARTLHDGVLQTLAVIQRRSDDDELKALAREQEIDLRNFLYGGGAVDDTRTGPSAMQVEPALRAAAGRFTKLHGGLADVVVVDGVTASPPTTDALVGAVTEALNNAGKHGEAAHATVFVDDAGDGWLFCSVKDDGTGFDEASTQEGVGIAGSIRARIEDVGGRVEIDGRRGRGTEVRMWLPV